MAITNIEVIRFTNEEVRPIAERLRDLDHIISDLLTSWYGGINTVCPNDPGESLEDGRESEGVSRLSGEDINSLMAVVATMKSTFDGAGVRDVINKPTVRSLNV